MAISPDSSRASSRPLTADEHAAIRAVFERLNQQFIMWAEYHDDPHMLVTFAFYEGCGESILAEAAPLALADKLVREHGFAWLMVADGGEWRHAVVHPALAGPIVLHTLEDGTWVDDDLKKYDWAGMRTNNSYENIVRRVGGTPDV